MRSPLKIVRDLLPVTRATLAREQAAAKEYARRAYDDGISHGRAIGARESVATSESGGPFPQWRQWSSQYAGTEDIPDSDRLRMIQDARTLYAHRGIAKQIVDLTAAFVCGSGITAEHEDPRANAILQDVWTDPRADLRYWQYKLAQSLLVTGELHIRPTVFPESGRVIFSAMDPARVDAILPLPDGMQDWGIIEAADTGRQVLRRAVGALSVDDLRSTYRRGKPGGTAAMTPPDLAAAMAQRGGPGRYLYAGDVMPFCFSRPLHGSRGRSMLLPVQDYFDAHDKLVYYGLQRARIASMLPILLKASGNSAELKELLIKLKLMDEKTGSIDFPDGPTILAVSGDVSIESPKLDGVPADFEAIERIARLTMLSAFSIPEHFLSWGGDANRATAIAMNSPVFMYFSGVQREIVHIFRTLAAFSLRIAVCHGQLRLSEQDLIAGLTVAAPDIDQRDEMAASQSLLQLVTAIRSAIDAGIGFSVDAGLTMLEQAIKGQGYDVEFPAHDAADATEPETALPDIYAYHLENNIVSIDDVRKRLKLDPIGGADGQLTPTEYAIKYGLPVAGQAVDSGAPVQ